MQKKANSLHKYDNRISSIELIKIFAIFLICISHTIQTLTEKNSYVSNELFLVNISTATTDIQNFILLLLRHSGVIGNSIFFVCSAWFLLDSKKVNFKKWTGIIVEVWAVSVIILLITYTARDGNIDKQLITKSLFPTTNGTNWYLTCYILFYPIHTKLNDIINGLSQSNLLKTVIVLNFLYIVINFIYGNLYYSTPPILWVTIYFTVAYIKNYNRNLADNKKIAIAVLILAVACHIGLIIITNTRGLRDPDYANKMLRWNKNSNPFLLIAAIALFNLFRNIEFKNRFINYISSFSMLIYMLHENIIIRSYYRPYAICYIRENFGLDHVILYMLIFAAVLFLISAIISIVYDISLRKIILKISDLIYISVQKIWSRLERILIKAN